MELTISTPRLAAARILPRTPRAFYRTAINAFFFVMGMVFASWAVRIPDIKAALQMSDAALGSVLLAAPLGEMLSIAPTAWLIGRFRSRRVIMLGLMLMPCALLSLALAGSPHWLAAALLGFGFANNMLNISLNAQAVGVETLYGRSIMATFHGMWSLGGVAGCIIGSIVAPLGVAPLPHFAAILVITLDGAPAPLCRHPRHHAGDAVLPAHLDHAPGSAHRRRSARKREALLPPRPLSDPARLHRPGQHGHGRRHV